MNAFSGAFQGSAPQIVGFLLIDQFALMSYASAIEPLRAANILAGRDLYEWRHIAVRDDRAMASNGAAVMADHRVGDQIALDSLLVCAGGAPSAFDDAPTLAWLRAQAQKGVRIGGISGGPYILARAGLLKGHRCTIHWEHAPALNEEFPDLDLRHTLYEIDRDRLTCSGGIAALDMVVELIERDHGPALAAAVGEWHLRTQVRAGDSSQRMTLQQRYGTANEKVLKALSFMELHIEEPSPVDHLAAVAGATPRQLQRLFLEHLGCTPMRQYLRLRLNRGQTLLRQTTMPLTEVAMACGFVSANHFARAYKGQFACSPRQEREPGSRRSLRKAAEVS